MRNNEGRTQIPPELLEQFMKQQEEKITGAPAPAPPMAATTMGYQVPTDYVNLPSEGRLYPDGHPWKNKDKVEVRYMTTKEEDILANQNYAKAGVLFDKLIDSILVDRVAVDSILPGDKNAIIINARKNSYGENYTFASICENCFADFEHTINLSNLSSVEFDMSKVSQNNTCIVELPVSKKIIEFRIATSQDLKKVAQQVETRKKHGLEVSETSELHRVMIVSIDGSDNSNLISSFASQMLVRDSRFLRKQYEKMKPDVDFTFVHNCTECGHKNKGGVPVGTNFFWFND